MPNNRTNQRWPGVTAALAVAAAIAMLQPKNSAAAKPDGQLEVRVVDAESGEPLAARVHLRDGRRRPVRSRGLGLAPHGDHFYLDGAAVLGLRRGPYTFDLDAGAERRTRSGHFEIDRRSEDSKTVEVKRYANLADEGWFGADLDCDRKLLDLGVVLRAEQIAFAPLTDWSATTKGWKQATRNQAARQTPPPGVQMSGARWESAGGALLLFAPDGSAGAATRPPAEPLTAAALQAARDAGWRVVLADLSSWRTPVWLASGVIDAACVIDRASGAGEAKRSRGRPRKKTFYPGRKGAGRWREDIYFHALNAGLTLPAVAGSGSGATPSPLGANRVYAAVRAGFAEGEFDAAAWWRAALAGATVVTNGPLLRPNVFGQPPGYRFEVDGDGRFDAAIGLNLSTRDTIDYLELLQNGEAVISVRLKELAASGGRLPELAFDAPGWFAVRAVTTDSQRYQHALTGPYFIDGSTGPRISNASCAFFLEWLNELAEQPAATRGDDADLAAAREFWRSRLANANAP